MSSVYIVEATIHRGFLDPTGPAEAGWSASPWSALCQIEDGVARDTLLQVSDTGYRTRASDPNGVVAYPPRVVGGISVDVAANLDPTQSAVAAAWGSLTLANIDGIYDDLLTSWQTDGRAVTIYRGDRTYDAARGLDVDPPWASLQRIFAGVMGALTVAPNEMTIPLHDASFYLERQFARTLYGGTGTSDGTDTLTGTTKPISIGGETTFPIANITPLSIDPANLVYQFADGAGLAVAAYDGGVALAHDSPTGNVYGGTVAAGHFRSTPTGLLQVGSAPIFTLTADVVGQTYPDAKIGTQALAILSGPLALPDSLVGGAGTGTIESYCVDPAVQTAVLGLRCGIYIASGDDVDGLTAVHRLIVSSGANLVPGRDGALRLLILAAIPGGSTPVLDLDDTNIVTIAQAALPATLDPPPWRIRLGYQRNNTIMASNVIAGAASDSRKAYVALPVRAATALGAVLQATAFARRNDPDVIGADGGSTETTITATQTVANALAALWGTQRRLYEITVPASVGADLDWASIVSVTSSFDNLDGGKLGQVVGWRYSTTDGTALFRILV